MNPKRPIDNCGYGEWNERGKMLLNYLNDQQFFAMNSFNKTTHTQYWQDCSLPSETTD